MASLPPKPEDLPPRPDHPNSPPRAYGIHDRHYDSRSQYPPSNRHPRRDDRRADGRSFPSRYNGPHPPPPPRYDDRRAPPDTFERERFSRGGGGREYYDRDRRPEGWGDSRGDTRPRDQRDARQWDRGAPRSSRDWHTASGYESDRRFEPPRDRDRYREPPRSDTYVPSMDRGAHVRPPSPSQQRHRGSPPYHGRPRSRSSSPSREHRTPGRSPGRSRRSPSPRTRFSSQHTRERSRHSSTSPRREAQQSSWEPNAAQASTNSIKLENFPDRPTKLPNIQSPMTPATANGSGVILPPEPDSITASPSSPIKPEPSESALSPLSQSVLVKTEAPTVTVKLVDSEGDIKMEDPLPETKATQQISSHSPNPLQQPALRTTQQGFKGHNNSVSQLRGQGRAASGSQEGGEPVSYEYINPTIWPRIRYIDTVSASGAVVRKEHHDNEYARLERESKIAQTRSLNSNEVYKAAYLETQRALREFEMSALELRTATCRRELADKELELVLAGSFGIDAPEEYLAKLVAEQMQDDEERAREEAERVARETQQEAETAAMKEPKNEDKPDLAGMEEAEKVMPGVSAESQEGIKTEEAEHVYIKQERRSPEVTAEPSAAPVDVKPLDILAAESMPP